jgi:hypothetical protein
LKVFEVRVDGNIEDDNNDGDDSDDDDDDDDGDDSAIVERKAEELGKKIPYYYSKSIESSLDFFLLNLSQFPLFFIVISFNTQL